MHSIRQVELIARLKWQLLVRVYSRSPHMSATGMVRELVRVVVQGRPPGMEIASRLSVVLQTHLDAQKRVSYTLWCSEDALYTFGETSIF